MARLDDGPCAHDVSAWPTTSLEARTDIPEGRAARLRVSVLIGLLGCLAACGGSGRTLGSAAPASDSAWLASLGYDRRAGDALVQARPREISALHVDSITQLLLRSPRVEVVVRNDNVKDYLLHRAPGWAARPAADTGCALEFYLNGNLVRQRTGDILWEMQPDRLFKPYDLTALEIFDAAHAPVGSEHDCGAVMYWIARLRHRDDPPFTATLSGVVVRMPEGKGIAGVPVQLEPGGLRQTTDARGVFDFGALPPTSYRVEAEVPDWGTYRTELPLRAGAIADVRIEIERAMRRGSR